MEITRMHTGNSKNIGHIQTIEPATTLMDEGTFLRIVTELPGISLRKKSELIGTFLYISHYCCV